MTLPLEKAVSLVDQDEDRDGIKKVKPTFCGDPRIQEVSRMVLVKAAGWVQRSLSPQ